jgi:hypothetical protein
MRFLASNDQLAAHLATLERAREIARQFPLPAGKPLMLHLISLSHLWRRRDYPYDFFDQCPHRMACARCAFYLPNRSSRVQLLEARENLLRLTQEIPLRDEERAAVEERIEFMEKLCQQLADVPKHGSLVRKATLQGDAWQ